MPTPCAPILGVAGFSTKIWPLAFLSTTFALRWLRWLRIVDSASPRARLPTLFIA
jgi:hypothetical protein